MIRPPLAVAAALIALLATACEKKEKPPAPGPPGGGRAARLVPVEVAEVTPQPVTFAIETVGSLEARETLHVPARVAGIVQDVAFDEGATVKRGELLCRIDPDRYRLVAQREAAEVQQAEASAREAESALSRRKELRERNEGWVSEEEIESFDVRLEQSNAQLASARATRDLAYDDLRDSEVRATTAGIIDAKLVETGQQVAAGQAVATIVDVSQLKLVFKVAEGESVRMEPGGKLTFRSKSAPDRDLTATIFHVGGTADAGTRRVEGLAWVDDPDPSLKPGFFVDVRVEIGPDREALVVPETAVLPTDRGFVTYVLHRPPASSEVAGPPTVAERKLELGLRTRDGKVEVVSGLSPGDVIVVRGGAALRDGAPVQVVEKQGEGAPS